MFWKGKVNTSTQLWAFIKKWDVTLAKNLKEPGLLQPGKGVCKISVASIKDIAGISKLLNSHYDLSDTKSKTDISESWVKLTFLLYQAIWIVAKDPLGTIRGCVVSFKSKAPYPNAFGGCSMSDPWAIVDWFCVHPLWREKGVGSEMLEALDLVTFKLGRKAHVFLKEGYPLPLPQIPVYSTFLHCRRAGSSLVQRMSDGTGLNVTPYQCNDRETGLPLVKVEGIRGSNVDPEKIKAWEDSLDRHLPPCWVFVTSADNVDNTRGWKQDSMVSMYAFRWLPGKWLGSVPDAKVL